MSAGSRFVTVMIQRDGAVGARTYRLRTWWFRAALGAAGLLLAGVVVTLALYGPIVRAAARVPGLEREVARLQADNAKIRQLSAALDSVEATYAQLRRMIGADIVPDRAPSSGGLPVAVPVFARPAGAPPFYGTGASIPAHWPLDEPGYMTRGQVGPSGKDEAHPGLDVAVPVGSAVRAAGGGTVREAGEDSEYGLYVLLVHPDGYETMYGHLSRVLVRPGAQIMPGAVIGLTGNSGRSSAPHLHFEIRQNGTALDPLTMVKERR